MSTNHTPPKVSNWDKENGEQVRLGIRLDESELEDSRMVDRSENPPLRVFESGSIVLYLAVKFGAVLPTDRAGAPRRERHSAVDFATRTKDRISE